MRPIFKYQGPYIEKLIVELGRLCLSKELEMIVETNLDFKPECCITITNHYYLPQEDDPT